MPHLLCFGYGYTASFLAQRLLGAGWRISGTTRKAEKAASMREAGINPLVWDGETRFTGDLSGVTHILHSIKPEAGGDAVLHHCGDVLANMPDLRWIGYLSTTGVYGDRGGDWVDETTPLSPEVARSERRAVAEERWQAWAQAHGTRLDVFRLAAIYGPNRSALTRVRAGKARRIALLDQYFSYIHVDDIATTLQAAIMQGRDGTIYNLADDEPVASAIVTEYAATLLGMEPPPLQTLEEAELSAMARSFYMSSRRVRNDKIKRDLGVQLRYPNYRVGLRAIHATGDY